MNENTPNNSTVEDNAAAMTPSRKRWMMEQYKRMINLVPHGKHKNQKGTKGAFGKPKSLTRK